MSRETRDTGVLRHAVDNAEFVDIFVGADDFLGVSLQACTAAKQVSSMDKRFEPQEGWVGLDVIDIRSGGAVERHNQGEGNLKIRPKDQVVAVDGFNRYAEAIHRIDTYS